MVHQQPNRPPAHQRITTLFVQRSPEGAIAQRYVWTPDPLIIAFAHDPLTVGIYVAVARLAYAARGAVPLAARDLAAWMGRDTDADRAAIMRRIVKLAQAGWLVVERHSTHKHRLLPTWGPDQTGHVRPWYFDADDSGKPAHLRGRRVPLSLFDDYLGRLDPQPGHRRALISRYLSRPLLDLTDIGVYAIGLRAEIAPTPRLCHLANTGVHPLGFAVSQMRLGNAPPSQEELDRWVAQTQRSADRYEAWRHVEPVTASDGDAHHEVELEARVRALAPPDASLADLCTLAGLLEDGCTDAEALMRLQATQHGGRP